MLMKKAFLVLLLLVCSCSGLNNMARNSRVAVEDGPTIDIVFCLDLSGSTNELLPAFQKQLWDIVMQFSHVSPAPRLRLGLIGTGRTYYRKENSYVSILSPLTSNIDEFAHKIYSIEPLIKLGKPNNVNAAIQSAVRDLRWSPHPGSIRLLYVIGNGHISYGTYNAYRAAEEARNAGITVNSIFCTNPKNMKELTEWKTMADISGGHFATFNPATARVIFYNPSSQLEQLRAVNEHLNASYVSYTYAGAFNKKIQKELDSLSFGIHPSVFQSRALLKATALYQQQNHAWDLVDMHTRSAAHSSEPEAFSSRGIRKNMPDYLRNMSREEFIRLIEQKESERRKSLNSIRDLSPILTAHLDSERKKLQLKEGNTIKDILLTSLDEYLEEGEFEKEGVQKPGTGSTYPVNKKEP
jgi:hypothetical protein